MVSFVKENFGFLKSLYDLSYSAVGFGCMYLIMADHNIKKNLEGYGNVVYSLTNKLAHLNVEMGEV
jgi:hypothetical protein